MGMCELSLRMSPMDVLLGVKSRKASTHERKASAFSRATRKTTSPSIAVGTLYWSFGGSS